MMAIALFIVRDRERQHHLSPMMCPMSEKKIRLSKVQSLIRENAEKYLSKLVGTTQQVLVEGASKTSKSKMFGRTLTNKIVNFEANKK